jgi:hypothetical protein
MYKMQVENIALIKKIYMELKTVDSESAERFKDENPFESVPEFCQANLGDGLLLSHSN